MRFRIVVLLFFLLLVPLEVQARSVYIDKSEVDPHGVSLSELVPSLERMIGTSEARKSDRVNLYKKYDNLVTSVNELASQLVAGEDKRKGLFLVDDGDFNASLLSIKGAVEQMISVCNKSKKMTKQEYRSFVSTLNSIQSDVQEIQLLLSVAVSQSNPALPGGNHGNHGNHGNYPYPNNPNQPYPNNPDVYNVDGYLVQAMSDYDYNSLLQALQKEKFDDSRMRLVQTVAQSTYLKVSQVKGIVKSMTFAKAKTQAATLLYANTVDRQNWFQIYELFSFESDKKIVRDYVMQYSSGNANAGSNYIYPLQESEYNSLRAALKKESFDDGKRIVLSSAVANSYFLVDQVIGIINSFTFGDAKVSVALELYPRVVDAKNWYKVYGAFTFDSEKESVKNGVSSLQPVAY